MKCTFAVLFLMALLSGCAIKVEDFNSSGPISSSSMIGCMQKPMNHQSITSKKGIVINSSENVTNCINNESELSTKNINRSILLKKKKVEVKKQVHTDSKFKKEIKDAADKKEFENIEKVVTEKIN